MDSDDDDNDTAPYELAASCCLAPRARDIVDMIFFHVHFSCFLHFEFSQANYVLFSPDALMMIDALMMMFTQFLSYQIQ